MFLALLFQLVFYYSSSFLVFNGTILKTKTGMAMKAAGDNQDFIASGINVDKQRIVGTMISTILGAVGIVVMHKVLVLSVISLL